MASSTVQPHTLEHGWQRLKDSLLPWYALLILILTPIYYKTLLPGLGFWGDSAKFQFAGKVLGTAHLPGYPLYLMLNYAFVNLFPKGTLAFKVNLLSACFSLLAILVFFNLLVELRIRPLVAFASSLTYALSYTFWLFSLVAEVYSLNILFVAIVLNLLIRWRQSRRDRYFYAACLAYAISFGNHQTMIALLPSFIYLVWITEKSIFWNPKKILIVLGCIALGLSQYLYIAWRTNDPSTLFLESDTQAWLNFMRSPGTDVAFHMTLSEIMSERVPLALGFFWTNFLLLIPLAIWGVVLVKERWLNVALLLLLVTNTLLVLQLEFPGPDGVYMPSFLVVAIYTSFALEEIARRLLGKPGFTLVLLAIPALILAINYQRVDQSQHTLHAEIVEKVMAELNHGALILADEYEYATYFWYYLIGEGQGARDIYALPHYDADADQIQRYLEGQEGIYIWEQRLTVPPGLPVYTLWKIAPELEQMGFQVDETGLKYLYKVRLPEEY